MFKLSEPLLKFVCLLLAALLLFQVVRLVIRNNPLERLQVPELPTLQADEKGTNSISGQVVGKKGTNSVASTDSGTKGTNSATGQVSRKTDTNSVAGQGIEKAGTNAVLSQSSGMRDTNSVAGTESGSKGTNSVPEQAAGNTGTNSGPRQFSARGGPGFGPGQPLGVKAPDLPPIIQARVDKITLSELLAPIMRPLPMALLGIAGKDAFLRAPSGQTGMVKEGDELGGMKLLLIGINRVLIEHEGEKKELTIFSGFGSESLLPKQKETTTNEITTKPK
jgi:hypothetical protein